ncbi:tetratricopeptide TPR_2 repeat protein [Weissella oryzae SG25]|uniref:Tetratricopeptide TPR_2 repeat protein n=1 Tax=Weissella oryzae (strain DSM 25784 / JCM 18191 / LMG 30913 / SG25) TaxID=1329250 RepID=A0A069CS56_WEIOS|nr:tetratricopeptide repeat protein [Weissella oryzae]GAK30645.1 tetratricopeptide TPR_2 repeat protein [Weissella oryzae SG25]
MTPAEAAQNDIKSLVSKIESKPDDWRAYIDLVNVLMITENYTEAEELALKSLGLFDKIQAARPHLFYALGNVYYSAGEYALANQYFNQINDDKLKHDATMMQAQGWYAQNKYQQALVFALTGVEQDATDVSAQILLGNIWLALQNSWEAQEAFDAAIKVEPDNFDANFARGVVAVVKGDDENAWLLKAKQLDPTKFQAQAKRLDEITQLLAGQVDNEHE